jgi:hypothetical protein
LEIVMYLNSYVIRKRVEDIYYVPFF